MKQVIVGTFDLGCNYVQVVLVEEDGGRFDTKPEHGHVARIQIGANYQRWQDVMDILMHEAMELSFVLRQCRYHPSYTIAYDHAAYIFMATHTQFNECCSMVSMFLVQAVPAVSKSWKKWNNQKKARARK